MGEKGFFIESEEEFEASLYNRDALIDQDRNELQHFLEQMFLKQWGIVNFVHESLIAAAILIGSQQQEQQLLKVQPLGQLFKLGQGNLILILG